MRCQKCKEIHDFIGICESCGHQQRITTESSCGVHLFYWFIIVLFILALNLMSCSKIYYPIKTDKVDVWVLAGQSNALSTAQKHPPYFSKTENVWVSNRPKAGPNERTSMVWDLYIPTAKKPSWHSIAWIYLGDKLYRHTGRSQAFINIAQGATSTREHVPGTEYFKRLKFILKKQPDIKAVLWIQGESDWAEGLSQKESYQNMKEMILEARKIQCVEFYIALNSHKNAGERSAIRLAQEKIIAEGLAKRGPDLDRLRVEGLTERTGGEFVGAGFEAVAQAWFEVLK